MFEKLFKQATMELKRDKTGKISIQEPAPSPASGPLKQKAGSPVAEKKPVGPKVASPADKPMGPATSKNPPKVQPSFDKAPENAPLPPQPGDSAFLRRQRRIERAGPSDRSEVEKTPSSPSSKAALKPDTKSVRSFSGAKAGLLVLLLVVLAGAVLSSIGILDISFVLNYPGVGHEQVTQAPVPSKQPPKLPEKAAGIPKPAQENAPPPLPAPSVPTPAPAPKPEKQSEPVTSATGTQAGSDTNQDGGKAPSPSAQEQPKPQEVAAKPEPRPAPIQTQTPAKPAAAEISPPLLPRTSQYPYSVYLGSYKAPEAVKKAISEFQAKGLSPYCTKVDLGEKGVWFRVFSGNFRTKEEVVKFIRDHTIQGAEAGFTRFANLIGIYGSDREAEGQKSALLSAGFYPYVIKQADGKALLYSGAFDRKEFAEKERSVLASKGIKSEVVER